MRCPSSLGQVVSDFKNMQPNKIPDYLLGSFWSSMNYFGLFYSFLLMIKFAKLLNFITFIKGLTCDLYRGRHILYVIWLYELVTECSCIQLVCTTVFSGRMLKVGNVNQSLVQLFSTYGPWITCGLQPSVWWSVRKANNFCFFVFLNKILILDIHWIPILGDCAFS